MRNPYLYRGLAVLTVMALVAYLLVDHWLMPRSTRQHTVVRVPDLVGMPIGEAIDLLAEHAFEFGDTLRLLDPDVEDAQLWQVVDQNPRPGAQAKPGRRVFLYLPRTISREAMVPDVSGESPRNARALIEAAGLVVSDVIPDTLPSPLAGPVTRSVPPAGTMLMRGDSVLVFYGSGPDAARLVEVPDLTGLPIEEARRQLAALNLSAYVHNPSAADSVLAETVRIERHEPEAGTLTAAGSLVRLYTSVAN